MWFGRCRLRRFGFRPLGSRKGRIGDLEGSGSVLGSLCLECWCIRRSHRSGHFYRNPRHADVRPIEKFDSLCCVFLRLESDIANAPLGDQLDIRDLFALGGKVLAKVRLGDVGRQIFDEYPRGLGRISGGHFVGWPAG